MAKKGTAVIVIPKQTEMVDAASLTPDKVREITSIARKQYDLEREIKKLGETLGEKNKELVRVRTIDLPNAMKAAGVTALSLSKGYTVSVKDFVTGYIKEENKPAAFAWLRANKFGSLIKNVVSCSFGMGEDKAAKALKSLLRKAKIAYEDKEDIHYQTLQAFVRERLKFGKELPDSIEYHTVPTTEIKESKDGKTQSEG